MTNDPQSSIEPNDPAAYPHYPPRLPQAARLIYTVTTEPAPGSEAKATPESQPARK